jgi:glycerol-3-phosphate dehydrogenase
VTKNRAFFRSGDLKYLEIFSAQVTTCYGGRNRKVAEQFVLQGKSIEQLEAELLNGQKLQVSKH